MLSNLFFPFKIFKACGFVPLVLAILLFSISWYFNEFISGMLIKEIIRSQIKQNIPEWVISNLILTAFILPWLIIFPIIIAVSAYPSRLSFLKNDNILLKDNLYMFWLSLPKSFSAYAFMWKILPWYILPLIAILMTEQIAYNFIPLSYQIIYHLCMIGLSIFFLHKCFPIILVPLTSVIGMYDPYSSLQISRHAFFLTKWQVWQITLAIIILFILISQDQTLIKQYPNIIKILLLVGLYYWLSVCSVIYVRAIAEFEAKPR